MNWYNENDPKAAAWLRELIAQGLIAPGIVDERSITDVKAEELTEYRQCHFFAGIGGWSLALRLAGWPDNEEVWTGSCPCQPFSVAGKAEGVGDERHLWPAFHRLIAQRKPAVVFGEQVASKDGRLWLAGVRTDLEGIGYAVGAADLCAAGVGAPHIRQRLFWLADAGHQQSWRPTRTIETENGRTLSNAAGCSVTDRMADTASGGLGINGGTSMCPRHSDERSASGGVGDTIQPGLEGHTGNERDGNQSGRNGEESIGSIAAAGGAGRLADTNGGVASNGELHRSREHRREQKDSGTNFWSNCEFIPCRDGKARRIESGSQPLAHGVPARMVRLRGYGNAIVPEVARQFVEAYLETKLLTAP